MCHLLTLSDAFVFNLKCRYFWSPDLQVCFLCWYRNGYFFFRFCPLCIQVYIQFENTDTCIHTIQKRQIVWSFQKCSIKIFLCLNHGIEFPILTQSYCTEILFPMSCLQHWQKLYHMLYSSKTQSSFLLWIEQYKHLCSTGIFDFIILHGMRWNMNWFSFSCLMI